MQQPWVFPTFGPFGFGPYPLPFSGPALPCPPAVADGRDFGITSAPQGSFRHDLPPPSSFQQCAEFDPATVLRTAPTDSILRQDAILRYLFAAHTAGQRWLLPYLEDMLQREW